jgi:hypothetical protein
MNFPALEANSKKITARVVDFRAIKGTTTVKEGVLCIDDTWTRLIAALNELYNYVDGTNEPEGITHLESQPSVTVTSTPTLPHRT